MNTPRPPTSRGGVKRRPAIRPGGLVARVVVGLLLNLIRLLPERAREVLARAAADLAWVLRVRRAVALDNLRQAYPELPVAERRAIARGAYRNLAVAGLEAVTSDLLSDAELERRVRVPDWKGLDQLLLGRRPVLIASAHFGSWELFAEVMARRGYVFSAVVRPLAGAFNEWVVRNRRRAGVELILQRGALFGMLRALGEGRAVVQLIDQVLPAKDGVFVPFFGRLACTTPALSMAALRAGAPVYVVMAAREPDGLVMYVDGPVDPPQGLDRRATVEAHTAQLTALVERGIRRFPEQWLWLHRRWKVQPDAERPVSPPPTRAGTAL